MRKPSITRTIKTANVTVMGCDITISELVNKTFPVYASEFPKDPSKQFVYIRKMYETDTFKVSQIVDISTVEKTYSMPLEQFLALAKIVEPKAESPEKSEKAEN